MNQNQTARNVIGVSSSPERRKPNRQTAASDGVKLWDLRKLRNFRTFSPYDSDTHSNSVDFDHSGNYLAFAGSDMRSVITGNILQCDYVVFAELIHFVTRSTGG
ncbi:hypothetical protein QQ045_019364 [Rhodiola kirilowii]